MTTIDIKEYFRTDMKRFKSAPFLFVGSGFSRRYIELEDWKGLLEKFCRSEKMRSFDYYNSSANSKLEEVAKLMALDFHKIWWENPENELKKSDYTQFGEMINTNSAIKYEISNYLRNKEIVENEYFNEIELLKKIQIDGVITTNWDKLLETLFPEFNPIVGQSGLLNTKSQGIGEIYKIHGCIDDFNSLVLTTADYNNFNERNPYLAAKLLTIFIEHPIIFIGYSISDENIISILKLISNCLSTQGVEKIKENLYFVSRNKGADTENRYTKSVLPVGDFNLPITNIYLNDFSPLYAVLGEYQRKFSVKYLRHIKENLLEIIRDNDPNSRISVIDIDDTANFQDLEFVIGVGIGSTIKAYTGFTEDDIIEDIIFDKGNYDNVKIVKYTLPETLRSYKDCPLYKYLRLGNFIEENGDLNLNVHDRISKKFRNRPSKWFKLENQSSKISDLVNKKKCEYNYDLKTDLLISRVILCGIENINLEKIRMFLHDNYDNYKNINSEYTSNNRTNYKKLVRIYDYIKYGNFPFEK